MVLFLGSLIRSSWTARISEVKSFPFGGTGDGFAAGPIWNRYSDYCGRGGLPGRTIVHFVSPVWEDPVIDQLYDLIGGNRTVWAATEEFYRRVLADDTLRPFFEHTDIARLISGQSMFISMLLGGRTVYTGKDIGTAHAQAQLQGLDDGHFDSFLQHFRDALLEVGVTGDNVEKIIKLLEAKRGAVLGRSE